MNGLEEQVRPLSLISRFRRRLRHVASLAGPPRTLSGHPKGGTGALIEPVVDGWASARLIFGSLLHQELIDQISQAPTNPTLLVTGEGEQSEDQGRCASGRVREVH